MNTKQLISCVGCSILLYSCNGDDTQSRIQLDINPNSSTTVRQIMALGENPMIARISVNSGAPQEFIFNDTSSELIAQITGIQVGEENDIEVRWIEVLNDFNVEISQQQQTFRATGDVTVDAQHTHTQYDYDADGVSNYDERLAETCVWRTQDNCEFDVPESLIANGDFSRGREYWGGIGIETFNADGEFCLNTQSDGGGYYFLHEVELTIDEGLNYTLYVDIQAQTEASATLSLATADTFAAIHREVAPAPTNMSTHTSRFLARSNYDNILLEIGFSGDFVNRYCIDNVRLIATAIQ